MLLPETGQGTVALDTKSLESVYTGVVLFVRPHFRFDSRTKTARRRRLGQRQRR